ITGVGSGTITYTSSDPSRATVDEDGNVTIIGDAGGEPITITATKAGDENHSKIEASYSFTIAKRNLVVTPENKTKVYGTVNPALTFNYSGFVAGEDESDLDSTKPTAKTTASIDSAVGAYPITMDLAEAVDKNYKYIAGANGTLTVSATNQEPLNFTKVLLTKTYGDDVFNNPLNGGGSSTITYTSSDESRATVDAKGNVTIKGATLADTPVKITATKAGIAGQTEELKASYEIVVAKKALTARANNKTRLVNVANPAFDLTYEGFAYGETIANVTGTKPVASTIADGNSPAGAYDITVDTTSANSPNYTFAGVKGTLTITETDQEAILFTSSAVTKTYGDVTFTNPLAVVGKGTGAVAYESSDEDVATVDNTGKIIILSAGKATITATKQGDATYKGPASDSFTLTVAKAVLKVSSDDKTKVYKTTNPELTLKYSGFVNGDNLGSLSEDKPKVTTDASQSSNAGVYPIFVDTSEAKDKNYLYKTDVIGNLTITKAEQPAISFEDATPTLTYGDDKYSNPITGVGSG
ncbi:MAG: MBG domain-containing protein, partial [Anaerovoracaceae bacterium]